MLEKITSLDVSWREKSTESAINLLNFVRLLLFNVKMNPTQYSFQLVTVCIMYESFPVLFFKVPPESLFFACLALVYLFNALYVNAEVKNKVYLHFQFGRY